MATHKVDFLEIKTHEERPEFVNPSESAFAGKAVLVNSGIEQAFTAPFGGLTIALIFVDIGNELMIEAHFAGLTGIETTVSIEVCPSNRHPQAFNGFEGVLQMGLEVIRLVVIASDNL